MIGICDEFWIGVGLALYIFTPIIWPVMYFTGKGKKIDLLVGDLLKAVESGRWQIPNRPPKYPWERM